jgi:hypothetical protein
VWKPPRSKWRKRYKGWGAMQKLKYMDRVGRRLSDTEPSHAQGFTDITVEEMKDTVEQFYEKNAHEPREVGELLLDNDLRDIFKVSPRKRKGVRPAVDLLREHRKAITDQLTYWTGVRRPLIKLLLESIEGRLEVLGLNSDVKCEKQHLTEMTVFSTTLAMNYLARGKFVQM